MVNEVNTELQRKTVQFYLLQAHLQELQRRQELVVERLGELARTKTAFAELKTVKAGSTAMIPLGGENFISGKITNTETVFVSIGGGVVIKKPAEAAVAILDGRIAELEKLGNELVAEISATIDQLTRLQTELETAAEKK